LCVVLESISSLYFGVPAPWSFVARWLRLRPFSLVWSGVDDFVRRTWRPPSIVEKFLSESGIKVTVVTWHSLGGEIKKNSGRDLITGKPYS